MNLKTMPQMLTMQERKGWEIVFKFCSQEIVAYLFPEFCKHFFDAFADYSQTHLFANIDKFLEECKQDPQMPMVYGFALCYYAACNDWEKFHQDFARAAKIFPHFQLWQVIFNSAVFAEFSFSDEAGNQDSH